MLKKLFIIGIIFFLLAFAFAGYFIFLRPSASTKDLSPVIDQNFPLSGNRPVGAGDDRNQNGTATPLQNVFAASALVKITSTPTAGGKAFTMGSTTTVRYVEKGTGHIIDTNTDTGTVTTIINTTIPKIYEALMSDDGKNTTLRYVGEDLRNIQTYTYSGLSGSFLPINVESMAYAPSSKQLFYLKQNLDGMVGVVSNLEKTKSATLFRSTITEWLGSWPEENTIAVATKPASSEAGYLYFVNAKTGSMKKILGDVNGLTTLVDPTAQYVAYTDSTNVLKILDTKTGLTTRTDVITLSEKCAWSPVEKATLYCAIPENIPTAPYPEAWYKGYISFNDNIYRISVENTAPVLVGSLRKTYKQDIDIVNPSISKNGKYFIFGNKKDYSLWSLNLTSN